VARISDSTNRPKGTGFLVRGNDLDPRCGAEAFLLTNAHVVSDDPPVVNKGALRPDEAVVSFQAIGEAYGASPRLKIKKLLWTSAPWELDTTLLRLEKPVEGSSICPIERTPPTRAHTDRVYVIGHPGGRDIEISLYDNLLLGFQDPRVHYRAPTEGGSSGSPVFDDKWRVIALHHAGFGETPKLNQKPGQHETYAANEGIWIEAICQALAKVETVC
jgi:V8-like Glu-specific endopeptidase